MKGGVFESSRILYVAVYRPKDPLHVGEGPLFLARAAAASTDMPIFRGGHRWTGMPSMPLRALLYRRPSEPSNVQVVLDRSIYLVRVRRHRQARRYTLRSA